MTSTDLILAILIFATALLYASVGHAGASGYLAAMALMAIAPPVMKPSALTLNIVVAIIATTKFYRRGAFSWHLWWPFALTSIPCAYLGGMLTVPGYIYKPIVGLVLIYSGWRSLQFAHQPYTVVAVRPHLYLLLGIGAVLGFLSGLTGVGGGIFLSPLLLLLQLAEVRVISGTVAAFILVNSISGLLGVITTAPTLPLALPYWAVAAISGGFIGAEYGSKRLCNSTIQKLLAGVLVLAGVKMLMVV